MERTNSLFYAKREYYGAENGEQQRGPQNIKFVHIGQLTWMVYGAELYVGGRIKIVTKCASQWQNKKVTSEHKKH